MTISEDEKTERQRRIFGTLEKEASLLGFKLIDDGDPVNDEIIRTACLHSIAISLRRIANNMQE